MEYDALQTNERETRWVLRDPENKVYKNRKEIIWKILRILLTTWIILLCIATIVTFVVIPLVFMGFPSIQRLAMFSNFFLTSDPKEFEFIRLENVTFKNFHISFLVQEEQRNVSLGVWHILPQNLTHMTDFDAALLNEDFDVVVHFHGSGETRKDSVGMYSVLIQYFHVIAFDYRDFGDSTSATLSEEAVARDAVHIFDWIRSRTKNNIYIWGHSLGTPLATLTINKLNSFMRPFGLILEAPLTNMQEELPLHPFGKIFSWLPWFKPTILDPLKENGFLFDTSSYILKVDCPIMILHAVDDSIIPYYLGKKLSEIASNKRNSSQGNVTYYQIPAKYQLDHFRIYNYPYLNLCIETFVDDCHNFKESFRTIL